MTRLRPGLICIAVGWMAAAALSAEPATGSGPYEHAAVAADHPLASQVGVEILQQGGNVVDAAVAVSFSLSVLRPEGCGIGGGGFMLIWDADQQNAIALDYRERAPAAATREMFQNGDPESDGELSRHGGLAVAVPGNVAGLADVLAAHGSMSLSEVLAPVIRIAEDGFPVDEAFCRAQRAVRDDLESHDGYTDRFSRLREMYLGGDEPLEVGETFHSPLVQVLREISRGGAGSFYKGEIAESIADEVQRQGGVVTSRDLSGIKPKLREPLRGSFSGYDVLVMPPPSSGGVAILQMLNMLTALNRESGSPSPLNLELNSPDYVQLVTELMKHAFADRAEFLGDTDFAEVPVDRLISEDYAGSLAATIHLDRTNTPDAYGSGVIPDDAGTSHFSIIDQDGNAVACTETINTLFGSYVVVPEYGIILNNEMDDFSARPGEPNAFGLLQSEMNAIEPGKKPLSSMSPTILVRDGKAVFAVGGSGGPRIINGTFQALLNMVSHGLSPQDAVSTPRFHHQWQPHVLFMEEALFNELHDDLRQRGHEVNRRNDLANVQAVARLTDGLHGGSDPRKGGAAAGY